MLRDNSQMKLSLSPYYGLYEIVVPKEHLLRQIKENIDFSFVNQMLRKQHCEKFGRPAKEPEMMFKLMFLKKLYDLSDERLVNSAQTDMAYKYFLDLEEKRSAKNGNTYLRYVFSKKKCLKCSMCQQCHVGKSKAIERSYSITKPNEKNRVRLDFEESKFFRARLKVRHRIEEKNGEMKIAHGLDRADSTGLTAMQLQTYFTAFVVNVKRIVKLMSPIPA